MIVLRCYVLLYSAPGRLDGWLDDSGAITYFRLLLLALLLLPRRCILPLLLLQCNYFVIAVIFCVSHPLLTLLRALLSCGLCVTRTRCQGAEAYTRRITTTTDAGKLFTPVEPGMLHHAYEEQERRRLEEGLRKDLFTEADVLWRRLLLLYSKVM